MKLALFLVAGVLLVATSAFGSAVLTDDVYQLPAGDWRWVRFEIRQRPATAECRFEALGGGDVRAELVSRPELELFKEHRRHDALASTEPRNAGAISQYIEEPGEYAVIIENTDSHAVAIHLNVSLSFGVAKPVSRFLSPARRLTVILVSFAMFLAIVTFSARALLRAMKR
jgi:hypothetical protein